MGDVTVGESEPRDELEERWLPATRRRAGALFRRLITAAGGATQAHIHEVVERAEQRAQRRAESIERRLDAAMRPVDERSAALIAQQQEEIDTLRAQLEEAETAVAQHLGSPSIFDGVIVLQGYEDAFAAKDDDDSDEAASAGEKFIEQLGNFREPVLLVPKGVRLSGVTGIESKNTDHRVVGFTGPERRLP